MKQVAHGLDFSEVKEWEEAVKSMSRGTFEEDTNNPVKIAGFLELLAESVHRALLRDRFLFKIVTLKCVSRIFPHIHGRRLCLDFGYIHN